MQNEQKKIWLSKLIRDIQAIITDSWNTGTTIKKSSMYLLAYSFIFAITAGIVFSVFLLTGRSFVWSVDGTRIEIPVFAYVGEYIRELFTAIMNGNFALPMFDFSLGLGLDSINVMSVWYLEPFMLLSAFVPPQHVEIGFFVLTVVRFYFVGLAFSYFCFTKRTTVWATLAGSMVYTFCGLAIHYGPRHPVFLTPMIYLPLLLVGIDKLLQKKISRTLILMVFLSAWSSYYYTYVNTIIIGIYFLIRFFERYKEMRWHHFFAVLWRGVVSYLTGICMAAVVLLPAIYFFLHSVRGSAVVQSESLFSYGYKWITRLLVAFISPMDIGYWLWLNFPAIVGLGVLLLFLQKGTNKSCKQFFTILSLFLIFPLCGFVLSGFSTVHNRWCYAYAFVVAYIFVTSFSKLLQLSRREKYILIVVSIGYALIIFTSYLKLTPLALAAVLLLLCSLTMLLVCQACGGLLKRVTLLGAVVISIGLSSYFHYMASWSDYLNNQFLPYDSVVNNITNNAMLSVPIPKIGNGEFYRSDVQSRGVPSDPVFAGINASFLTEQYGTAIYYNVLSKEYVEYYKEMECADLWSNIIILGMDNRTFMDALANVKYYACRVRKGERNRNRPMPPFGFQLINSQKRTSGVDTDDNYVTDQIYENQHLLPLGFTYDSYLNRDTYNLLNSLEKQEALMQAVLLEEPLTGFTENSNLLFTSKNIDIKEIQTNGVNINGRTVQVHYPGATIDLQFEGEPNSETYLRFEGLDCSASIPNNEFGGSVNYFRVQSRLGEVPSVFMSSDHLYTTNTENYTVNLGFSKQLINKATIVFDTPCLFTLDDLKIYSQPMIAYRQNIRALAESTLQDVRFETNKVRGSIVVDRDKLLCLSIPYSEGWSAFVNGQPVQIMQANTMYMALPILKGQHEIELRYCTPGIKAGAIVTIAGWIGFFFIMTWQKRYKVVSLHEKKH